MMTSKKRTVFARLAVLALCGLVLAVAPANAMTGGYTDTKLVSETGDTVDHLGNAVATVDGTVVAGAPGNGPGSIHLFAPDGAGGYTESTFAPSGLAPDAQFGTSILALGEVLIVGAPWDSNDGDPPSATGAVYVLTPDGSGSYSHTRLLSSDGQDGDQFGWALTADGDAILVGAIGHDSPQDNAGAAYRFEPDGSGSYTETTKFSPSGLAGEALFGFDLAASNGNIFVSAPQDVFFSDSQGDVPAGRVYIFEPDGDSYSESSIDSPIECEFSGFGLGLNADGELLAVGAPGGCGYASGSIGIYQADQNGTYDFLTGFSVSDLDAMDGFGTSVVIDSDVIYATADAQYDDELGEAFPSVTRFDPNAAGGYSATTIRPTDSPENAGFGQSMTVANGTIIVGASSDTPDGGPDSSGSVYLFVPLDDQPPAVTGTSDPAPNAHGWLDQAAAISWSVVDPEPSSGVENPPPGDTDANIEGTHVYTSEQVCDLAGNCATGSLELSIDLSDPVVALIGPADGSSVPENEYTDPTCEATDEISGLDGSCTVDVIEVEINPEGRVLMATAMASDLAGHQTEVVSTYTVTPVATGPTCNGLPATIIGTEGNDRLFGTAGADVIVALGGNDRVIARGGDDVICLGDGRDQALGGDGDDTIFGGIGRDAISGGNGDDTLAGGDDRDRIFGQNGNDTIDGDGGNDTIDGGRGFDILNGGAGADRIRGGLDDDEIDGGQDDDRLFGQNGDDTIDGGIGTDLVNGGRGVDGCIGEIMTSCEL